MKIYDVTSGAVVNYSSLKTANEELIRAYCRQGYLDMQPIPEMRPDHELREISIKMRIEEGRQYVFGKHSGTVDSQESLDASSVGLKEFQQS